MKKIFTTVMLSFLMVLSACAPASVSLIDNMAKTSKWDKYQEDTKMTFIADGKDSDGTPFKSTIPVRVITTKDGEKAKADVRIDIRPLKKSVYDYMLKSATEEEKAEMKKQMNEFKDFNEIKLLFFTDGKKAIMKKPDFLKYFEESVPGAIADSKEDYIAFDTSKSVNVSGEKKDTEQARKYFASDEFTRDLKKLVEVGLKGFNPIKDVKLEGDTYVYETDLLSLKKDANALSDTLQKNINEIAPTLANMINKTGLEKVTAKELIESAKEMDTEDVKEVINEDETIKDVKLKITTKFEENTVYSTFNLKTIVKDTGNFELYSESQRTKDDSINVVLPKNFKLLTENDILGLSESDSSMDTEVAFNITIDGEEVDLDGNEPFIENDRTLVPFRAILERAGAKVDWNENQNKVTATLDGNTVEMIIGNKTILVNGKKVKLDVAPVIKDGRTYIPLRGAFESLGYGVGFTEKNTSYYITLERQ